MKPQRFMNLFVALFILALALTGSANAAAEMPQAETQIEAVNGQKGPLHVDTFADWYLADSSLNSLIVSLDRFYNVEASTEARMGSGTNAWKAAPNTVIWTNTLGKKFVDVQTGQEYDPFGNNGGRIVPLRRVGTSAVFAIYAQVWVTPGRGVRLDRPLNPCVDLEWGC